MSFEFSPETILNELEKEITVNLTEINDANEKLELIKGLQKQKGGLQPRSAYSCRCVTRWY